MKRATIRTAAAVLCGLFSVSSCQQFFTSSLAKALARDSYNLGSLSVDSALAVLDEALASGDARMAAALVAPLLSAVKDAPPGSEAYNTAASALVSSVELASEVGALMSGALTTLAEAGGGNLDSSLDLSAIIESVAAIELTPAEEEALILVSANIPDNLSAADSLAAALALVGNSLDANEIIPAIMGGGEGGFDSEDPALVAAMAFVEHAMIVDPSIAGFFTPSGGS